MNLQNDLVICFTNVSEECIQGENTRTGREETSFVLIVKFVKNSEELWSINRKYSTHMRTGIYEFLISCINSTQLINIH